MNRPTLLPVLIVTVLCSGLLLAADDLWTEDANAAMAQAAKEGKDLLIDFTGSDWCGWCKKLDAEVFSLAAFTTEAPKHFVMLKLDFPSKRKLSDETKKQNAEWQNRMNVGGYPTIVLADAKGKPYAQTGYKPGGPEAYLPHLTNLRAKKDERDAAFAKAEKLQGQAKAEALDAALKLIGTDLSRKSYPEVVAQIIELDADNKAGLKAKYEALATMDSIKTALRSKKYDEVTKLCDEALAKTGKTGETAQELLWNKSMAHYSKQEKDKAQACLEEALAAAPGSRLANQIKSVLKRVFNVEK